MAEVRVNTKRVVLCDIPRCSYPSCTTWETEDQGGFCCTGPFHIPQRVNEITFIVSTEKVRGAEEATVEEAIGPIFEAFDSLGIDIPNDEVPLWWWIEYD